MLIMTLAMVAAAQTEPLPFTDIHRRDIGCVAALAIIADDQRRGTVGSDAYPDVRDTGKRWAAIVGERVMAETGQAREVVAFAMTIAAKTEQDRVKGVADPAAVVAARVTECRTLMAADLAVADAPKVEPVSLGTDEPAIIEKRKSELREDMDNPQRIRFCAGMIQSAAGEISSREGKASRDALAFARLSKAFDAKLANLPKGDPPELASAEDVIAAQKAEPDKEEVVARCIRLGESLALALPPEG